MDAEAVESVRFHTVMFGWCCKAAFLQLTHVLCSNYVIDRDFTITAFER